MNKKLDLNVPIIFLTVTKNDRIQYVNVMIDELKRLKYTNFEIFYGVDIPLQQQITKDVLKYATYNINHDDEYYLNPNIFNCVLNHCMIIKKYFDLGYESIIVIEDDCQVKELETLMMCMNNIPDDADIVRLSVENCRYLNMDEKMN